MATARELASIVDHAQDAIFSKDLDGTVTSWNVGAQQMYGYTPEEMIGQSVKKLTIPGREGEIDTILNRLRHGEIIDHYVTKRRAKDGRIMDVSLMISPIRDKAGKVIAASTIARDVTTEQIVHRRNERSRLLAYILIVLLGFVGFLSLEHISNKVDAEARQRSVANCQATVKSNAVLRALVERSGAQIAAPAGADDALQRAYDDANQRALDFKNYAEGLLSDPDCSKLAKGP